MAQCPEFAYIYSSITLLFSIAFLWFLIMYVSLLQYFLHASICFNRFMAVVFPLLFNRVSFYIFFCLIKKTIILLNINVVNA